MAQQPSPVRRQVLDGRHRLRACEELGREPRVETYEGDEPAAHVLSMNLKRRHLSISQRATVSLSFIPELAKESKRGENLKSLPRDAEGHVTSSPSNDDELGRTMRAVDRVGAIVGVSGATIERAKRVAEEAPDLVPALRSGEMTVNAAHEIVIERKRKALQNGTGRVSGRSVERIARCLSRAGHCTDEDEQDVHRYTIGLCGR